MCVLSRVCRFSLQQMGRRRRFKRRSPLRRGRVSFIERALDAESLRDTIGTALYDRVMQWNDSGAAEALEMAEQRRKAKEVKKPCWLPKLNDDLYIGMVDWNEKDLGEVCTMPKSAVAFADESQGELCGTLTPLPLGDSEQKNQSSPALGLPESSNMQYDWAVLEASVDAPLMVDAVLEHCADGIRLFVGGWPVEPSGWDEADLQFDDGPCVVEAVLEDFGEGQRLLVGGWPVQPSWDELDTNWSQLGWDSRHLAKPPCWDDNHANSFLKGCNNWFSGQQSGWQGSSWCPKTASNSLYQGQLFMTAC